MHEYTNARKLNWTFSVRSIKLPVFTEKLAMSMKKAVHS